MWVSPTMFLPDTEWNPSNIMIVSVLILRDTKAGRRECRKTLGLQYCTCQGAEIIMSLIQCLSKHVPLHHAANYWDPGIIGKLFDYGALSSIGMLNNLEEQPISKINPDVSKVMLTFAI